MSALLAGFLMIDRVSADESLWTVDEIGDANGDSSLTEEDFSSMTGYMQSLNSINEENSDFTMDGKVDIADYVLMKNVFTEKQSYLESVCYGNISVPEDGEDVEYTFEWAKEVHSVTFDRTEQELFNKINDFRETYGVRKCSVYYLSLLACDSVAECYKENYNTKNRWDTIHARMLKYTSYASWRPFKAPSDDADRIFNELLSGPYGKGFLLRSDYNLGVGHDGEYWTVVMMY